MTTHPLNKELLFNNKYEISDEDKRRYIIINDTLYFLWMNASLNFSNSWGKYIDSQELQEFMESVVNLYNKMNDYKQRWRERTLKPTNK